MNLLLKLKLATLAKAIASAALLAAALSGCAGDPMFIRPFAETELFGHDGGGRSSFAAAGVTAIFENGAAIDVGPAARFDLGGDGGNGGEPVAGAVIRLRWGKP